jgi:hypothetical protein
VNPILLLACPVCYQPVDEVVRTSLNLGILVLLGTTVIVLACFARFFMSLARRSREASIEDVTT